MHYSCEPDFEPVPNLLQSEPGSDCISLARNKSEIIDTLTSFTVNVPFVLPTLI